MGHQVTLAARKRGVILRPLGDVVVLMPAPAMPAELVDRLCDVAIESIQEATATGWKAEDGRTRMRENVRLDRSRVTSVASGSRSRSASSAGDCARPIAADPPAKIRDGNDDQLRPA